MSMFIAPIVMKILSAFCGKIVMESGSDAV